MEAAILTNRTGQYHNQPLGYEAFYPAKLPFSPPVQYDDELQFTLSMADQAIGRLDSSADMIPSPDLFVGMYIRKEAVLSSQIEGVTQASLSEVLENEVRHHRRGIPEDITEVLNYVEAMNYALDRVKTLPLSSRLIREAHERLMKGVRGSEKDPGQFRTTQNWIGPPGCSIENALFIPPPPDVMSTALGDLERYIHEPSLTPELVKAGLLHYQFETIHPFLDGNGRIGRLLVVFYLCQKKVLKRPLLYLSEFIKAYKDEYYDRLQAVRETGRIEEWLKFFLTAIWRVSEAAAETARQVLALREAHRKEILEARPGSTYGLQFLDSLFQRPFVRVNHVAEDLGVSYPTANNLVGLFTAHGVLREVTGQGRNRLFMYHGYIDILEQGLSIVQPNESGPSLLKTVSC